MGQVLQLRPKGPDEYNSAKLPARYEAARAALEACVRVDECKAWADKAEAMASYGRQSRDSTLIDMSKRIKARAVRRGGELLKAIKPSKGGRPKTQGGTPPSSQRVEAAKAAGWSEDQAKQAMQVASVPAEKFEAMVDSSEPPTITELAELGKVRRSKDPEAQPTGEQRKRARSLWLEHPDWTKERVYAAVGFEPDNETQAKRCSECVDYEKHKANRLREERRQMAPVSQEKSPKASDPRTARRDARDAEILRLHEQNLGSSEIAKALGCSTSAVQEAKNRLGLIVRDDNPLRRVTNYAIEFCDTWDLMLAANRSHWASATPGHIAELTKWLRALTHKTNALIRRLNNEAKGEKS